MTEEKGWDKMRFSFLSEDIKSRKYYGSGDLAGHVFVNNVIDSLDSLENNLQELNDDIVETEDMYRYLWLLSFKEMVSEIDKYKIDDCVKNRIKHLSESIDYSPSRFIKFINKNVKSAFDKKDVSEERWYEYFDFIMNLVFNEYSSGIDSKALDYIENEYALDILAYFDKYAGYYKKHPERIKVLFKGLSTTRVFDDFIYCNFLLNNIVNDDGFIVNQAKFICERSISHIKSLNLSSDSEDILQVQNFFDKNRKIAISYHLLCANEYNEYKKKLDGLCNEYIKKHGQSFNFGPIDFKPIIDHFKESKNKFRFLQLTHQNKNGIIQNNFDLTPFDNKDSFSEFFDRIGQPRSEKYPYYKQDGMDLWLSIYCSLLAHIINDDELNSDFALYVFNLSKGVESEFFHSSIDFCNELTGIMELIGNAFGLLKDNQGETPLYKAIVNGCVMNEIGLLEKLLRNVALNDDKDICYFDQDSNTIGSLFKNHRFDKLSSGLMYYLEFYLSLETNGKLKKGEKPGKNIRNIQMHDHDDKYDKTKIDLCLELFYFLLSLLGDLALGKKLKI